MAILVGVGESKEVDPYVAGAEAAKSALESGGMTSCDFVLVFATTGYDQEDLLDGVRSVTGEAPLSGCSGEGVITQSGPDEGLRAVGVMAFSSDELKFQNFCAEGLRENSRGAGEKIGEEIRRDMPENPVVLLMFPDGLTVNAKELFEGVESKVGRYLPFAGGTAGVPMGSPHEFTYQYHNDQVLKDAVSCVLISGNVNAEIGVSHGCMPIGLQRTITKARANWIQEIDGRPAWEVFKEYVGDVEEFIVADVTLHLCIGEELPEEAEKEYGKYIIRAPLALNEEDGSVFIPTEMPAGTKIQMTRRDPEAISRAAKSMAEKIKGKLGDKKPVAVLHFDCAGRGKVLFGEQVKEKGVDVMQDVLGKDIPWLGFHTYGEIAPIVGRNYFHNYTVVLCVLYQ